MASRSDGSFLSGARAFPDTRQSERGDAPLDFFLLSPPDKIESWKVWKAFIQVAPDTRHRLLSVAHSATIARIRCPISCAMGTNTCVTAPETQCNRGGSEAEEHDITGGGEGA